MYVIQQYISCDICNVILYKCCCFYVHEFYLLHPNTDYLNDNLTPLIPVRQSMMCIKYSDNMCAESKAQNTPFIHTSLTFGSYKQTDLNSFLFPLSTYLSSLLPYLT